MNVDNEIKERLLRFADELQGVSDKGMEVATETVKQYLSWYFYSSMIEFILQVLIVISLGFGYKMFWKVSSTFQRENKEPSRSILGVIFSFISVLLFYLSIKDLFTMVQIQVAPNVFILEQLKELVR